LSEKDQPNSDIPNASGIEPDELEIILKNRLFPKQVPGPGKLRIKKSSLPPNRLMIDLTGCFRKTIEEVSLAVALRLKKKTIAQRFKNPAYCLREARRPYNRGEKRAELLKIREEFNSSDFISLPE
jgi:hypothetical protein